MKPQLPLLAATLLLPLAAADVFPGADENSPSRSHYFTWINNTNEGATIEQTAANMGFFQWLHDEYGMKGGGEELEPSVWITARELPFRARRHR